MQHSSLLHNLAILVLTATTTTAQHQKPPANYHKIVETHGITGSLAWVLIFPLGAVLIRVLSLKSTVWIHAAVQTLGLGLFIINIGQGASLLSHCCSLRDC